MTTPNGDGPFPAVVLVHGSGPHDRDETIGPNKVFKDLAWGLATRGILVLRYEKRTKQYQNEITDLSAFTLNEETVDDAVAAATLLRSTPNVDIDRIFVLGHSLGAMVAPRIAMCLVADWAGPPRGLIMMAANARDLPTLVVEQSEYLVALDGQVTDAEAVQLAQLRSQITLVREGKVQPGYDQVSAAQEVGVPMLFLQGERDYQVTMQDFNLWKEALSGCPTVAFNSYPSLNHLFIAGEGPANPTEYATAGNVAHEVVEDIATWVKGF
jgi:hypothetical protein